MKIPYTTKELDDLISACVEFTDDHENYFAGFNIASRNDVSTDADKVKAMMGWVSETDKGILEFTGFDKDNILNFKLGHDARQMMQDGGFKNYFRHRRIIENLHQVKIWSPIVIALLAFIVSCLAWQEPKGSSKKIDELEAQLSELQIHQAETKNTVARLQENLRTLASQLQKMRTGAQQNAPGDTPKTARP